MGASGTGSSVCCEVSWLSANALSLLPVYLLEFRVVYFGRCSFETPQLVANVTALVDVILRSKPAAAKGTYFEKMAISTTMGPGVNVDPSSALSLVAN